MPKEYDLQKILKELEDAKGLLAQQQQYKDHLVYTKEPYSPYGPVPNIYQHNKSCTCVGCNWEKVQNQKSQPYGLIDWGTVPVPYPTQKLTPQELAIMAKLPAQPLTHSSTKLKPIAGMVVSLDGGAKTFLAPDWIHLYTSSSQIGRSIANYWQQGRYAIYYTTAPKTRFSILK